jgi:hypothetical protein
VPRPEFKSLFCQRFGCPSAEFEEQAFRKCLPWHARLAAPVLRRLKPDFFAEDFRFIRYLGAATGWRELNSEILGFQDANRVSRNFLRTSFRIRVSGRKAAALAERLFSAARAQSRHGTDAVQ